MNTIILRFACALGLGVSATLARAQVQQPIASSPPEPYQVVERGPHHRIWQRVTWIPDPFGSFTPVTNSYTEVQTSMAHLVDGVWADSSDQIQVTATGAQATNSQHTVTFLGDINAAGALDVTTPEGKHLTSNVLGLTYFDSASGQSVWVGTTKSSNGELLPPGNEAVFPDAFSGCLADVLYVNHVSGCEQIIVIRAQLESCTNWGLNPATTLLGVVTEFDNPPQPVASQRVIAGVADTHLDFGIMKMARGSAFAIGDEGNRVPVSKQWLLLSNRWCLVEQVQLSAVAPLLQNLPPPPPGTASLDTSPGSVLHKLFAGTDEVQTGENEGSSGAASRRRLVALRAPHFALPAPLLARRDTPSLKLARSMPATKGFALDYALLTSQTNAFVFQADTVYYVSGTVTLSATNNVIEGLSVIKFTNSSAATIVPSGLIWKTAPYAPAIFSSKDDNTVGLGDLISGSTGNPSGFYGGIALDLSSIANPIVANARFSYLSNAVKGTSLTLRDVQFNQCASALAAGSLHSKFYNGLFYRVGTVINANNGPLGQDNPVLENVTGHFCTNLMGDTTGTINLTNCLFAAVTNWQCSTTYTNSCAFLSSDGGVFQIVGAAGQYLADQSPYRNAGTTNLDGTLLADLQKKTTYPPIVYSNVTFSTDTTFGPQAQRDTDIPDIGVHYDPIDYAFGGCTANGNLTFQQGTVAAWFRTTSGFGHFGHGIHLADTKLATFSGTATAPAWWVRYNTVQEQSNTNWSGGVGAGGITGWASYLTNSPEVHANFLHCAVLAGEGGSGNHFRDDNGYLLVRASDCEFNSGLLGGYVCSQFHTNNLFNRVSLWLAGGQPDTAWTFRNCTHYGGGFNINRFANPTPVSARDSAFDSTAVATSDSYSGNATVTDYDYNAFFPGTTNLTSPTGSHYVIVTNGFNWQTSWFGNFYQPTNLPTFRAGWVTADVAGLYHFTTQTNQTIEGTNIVTIGYHYVATDANGNPLDSNGDGIPDYLSDLNNNGLVDSGEIGWNIAADLGLKVLITRPRNGSTLP
ncbi:MAG TPA: hypothetical protein VNZ64_26015 [Candidatus Acidoferrum sp.]|jgi:hypothetical protein|nr:hypothetical protein [Candidatus Acidoferrum sp.]